MMTNVSHRTMLQRQRRLERKLERVTKVKEAAKLLVAEAFEDRRRMSQEHRRVLTQVEHAVELNFDPHLTDTGHVAALVFARVNAQRDSIQKFKLRVLDQEAHNAKMQVHLQDTRAELDRLKKERVAIERATCTGERHPDFGQDTLVAVIADQKRALDEAKHAAGPGLPEDEPAQSVDPTIDTLNRFAVAAGTDGTLGEFVQIVRPPIAPLRKADALNLAAYLVVLSGATRAEFDRVRTAVEST